MALAEELGLRPLVAHCHLGLGKLYRRGGKREEAREHLAIATTMYREMDMRFWLEQAETEWLQTGRWCGTVDGWPVNGRTARIDWRKPPTDRDDGSITLLLLER